jgi:hypothetical protein
MFIVGLLDDCSAGMEGVRVIDVVEPQEEVIGSGVNVFVHCDNFGWIGA